ncbi:uncharacterized protein LOC135399210 [Ornithodoros turicata]|uniref:uncharacterized protein LOC135399210 n=1 Tax=Ornithodoros turicata TaxID=34597 RepID=UPI003139D7C0
MASPSPSDCTVNTEWPSFTILQKQVQAPEDKDAAEQERKRRRAEAARERRARLGAAGRAAAAEAKRQHRARLPPEVRRAQEVASKRRQRARQPSAERRARAAEAQRQRRARIREQQQEQQQRVSEGVAVGGDLDFAGVSLEHDLWNAVTHLVPLLKQGRSTTQKRPTTYTMGCSCHPSIRTVATQTFPTGSMSIVSRSSQCNTIRLGLVALKTTSTQTEETPEHVAKKL